MPFSRLRSPFDDPGPYLSLLLPLSHGCGPVGTLADADLRRALAAKGKDILESPVKELMNFAKHFPFTCTSSTCSAPTYESCLYGSNRSPS